MELKEEIESVLDFPWIKEEILTFLKLFIFEVVCRYLQFV